MSDGKGRFIYHYYLTHQRRTGVEVSIDGVAQMTSRMICGDDYKKLKRDICEGHDDVDFNKSVIRSLSYLHREFE